MSRYSPYGAGAQGDQSNAGAPATSASEAAALAYGPALAGNIGGKPGACRFYAMGACTKGAACQFTHTNEGLQGLAGFLAANLGSAAAAASEAGGLRIGQFKGALCKFFQQGQPCNLGDACTYAHGLHELAGGYKQRVCKFFEETGTCSKGDGCTYAHGPAELLMGQQADELQMALSQEQFGGAWPSVSKALQPGLQPLGASGNLWGMGQASSAASLPALAMPQATASLAHGLFAPAVAARLGQGPNSTKTGGQRKGALCKYFQQGVTCNSGAACTYAHGIHELAGGFKQRICKFWEENGACMKGEACTYAHGSHELLVGEALAGAAVLPSAEDRALLSELQAGTAADPSAAKLRPLLGGLAGRKGALCRYWEMGQCVKGAACDFAHGLQELDPAGASLALAGLPGLGQLAWPQLAGAGPGDQGRRGPTNFKRALCKYFEQSGFCSAGPSCTYAHGPQELAQGYKKMMCKFWQESGSCNKGFNCTFAHGPEELQA